MSPTLHLLYLFAILTLLTSSGTASVDQCDLQYLTSKWNEACGGRTRLHIKRSLNKKLGFKVPEFPFLSMKIFRIDEKLVEKILKKNNGNRFKRDPVTALFHRCCSGLSCHVREFKPYCS